LLGAFRNRLHRDAGRGPFDEASNFGERDARFDQDVDVVRHDDVGVQKVAA
jgi:hypothetical protein